LLARKVLVINVLAGADGSMADSFFPYRINAQRRHLIMAEDKSGRQFDRLYVALMLPFKENYEVDEDALRRLVRYFMQPKFKDNINGAGIIINPDAGEIHYLTREEKRRNVEIAVEECGGKVPVFAGGFDLRVEDMIRVAVDAKEAGADGLFLSPPQGSLEVSRAWDPDKNPEIWADLIEAQVKATGLPVIVHPSAPATPAFGSGLPMRATLELCRRIPSIVGWKMFQSYVGSVHIARALRKLDRHVAILPANSNLFHENLATGYFDGALSGSFCYAMEPMIDHITAWKNKDLEEANRIWKSGLEDLQYYIDATHSRLHIRYKAAAWVRGTIPLPFMRAPNPWPTREEVITIKDLMVKAGLSVIPEKDLKPVLEQLRV
jgi:dihydrodipicolinate synthase/N-acetylneuraminate lyase